MMGGKYKLYEYHRRVPYINSVGILDNQMDGQNQCICICSIFEDGDVGAFGLSCIEN